MLMNCLALIVVLWMKLAIWTSDALRRFVGLEAQVTHLMIVRLLLIAESPVAKHQVVLRLQIFGINGQHAIECGDRVSVFTLKELDPPQIVDRYAISGILGQNFLQLSRSSVVISIASQHPRIEIVSTRKIRVDRKCLLQDGASTVHVAFLHGGASYVDPAIRILRINFRYFLERRFSAFQISLQ